MKAQYCFLVCVFAGISLQAQQPDSVFTAGIARHREHYKQEFLTDVRSPLGAQDTALLAFFPPDPVWMVTARLERTPDAPAFDMPTYSGRTKPFVCYGILYFQVAGKTCHLALYQNLNLRQQEAYQDYLFLPFKDYTNGDATYGGGRYIDFRTTDIAPDGTLTLDFNKAYNPWCAYSDGFNCPIPPAENHLEFAVEAGEKQFLGAKKH